MKFGARLKEERKRLGLRQADFADLAGTDAAKQSLYENGRRDLRGEYLARLVEAQVDVVYILTGRRSVGEWLAPGAADLLSAYLAMPSDMQVALENVARTLRDQVAGPSRTLHAGKLDYRAGEPL